MARFPEKIPLPEHVRLGRLTRKKDLLRNTFRGISLRGLVILIELFGFAFFNSSTLLLDALSSLFDIASSLFLVFCIRMASKPPDTNHPFGHGRFEPIGGLQLSLLLVVIGCGLIFQQVTQALAPHTGQLTPWLFVIPVFGALVLEMSHRRLKRVAKKQESPALFAEAMHYRVDALTSILAALVLISTQVFPHYSFVLDHLGAASIAGLMVIIGIIASKHNIDQLLDRAPEKKFFKLVREAALSVEGVLGTEKLRIQLYGPDAHVNIDIEVNPKFSVEKSHRITQGVRHAIQSAWPQVRDVTVHVEPYFPGDHVNPEE